MNKIQATKFKRIHSLLFFFLVYPCLVDATTQPSSTSALLGNLLHSSKKMSLAPLQDKIDKLAIKNLPLLQTTLNALNLTEHQQYLTIKQSFNSSESPSHTNIEILRENLLDDSIKSIYYSITFHKEGLANGLFGHWKVTSAQQAFSCRRKNINQYTKEFCS
jgi:hypothetical protein